MPVQENGLLYNEQGFLHKLTAIVVNLLFNFYFKWVNRWRNAGVCLNDTGCFIGFNHFPYNIHFAGRR